MQARKKRGLRLETAATRASAATHSPRLFIDSKTCGTSFLVDTGSDVSVIPRRATTDATPATDYSLYAVNGSRIPTFGTRELTLDVGLPKQYPWCFIIADVKQSIIGADFLSHFNLLPDLRNRKLVDNTNLCSIPAQIRTVAHTSVLSVQSVFRGDDRISQLLKQYNSITKPPQYHDEVHHDVICYIETTGAPTYDKPRRLRPDVEKEVKLEYKRQLKTGLVRISRSQWASGLIVKREKTKLRLIGDYRRLNAQTVPDRYPIPVVSDSTSLLRGKKVYSKVDLVRAFHNIPVYQPHIDKTAVISPVGLYENTRMPFGLRNAPSTFQRFMNAILSDFPFCTVYLDDILIFSDSVDEHFNHLQLIFQQLAKNGLSINLDKCSFCVTELQFLGYKITTEGFTPTDHRVKFMKEMKPPRTIAALRSVLGILNFYRQFTKGAARLLAPLQELLKGHPKKNDKTPIEWTPQLLQTFKEAQDGFVNYTLLRYQRLGAPLFLTTDASKTAIGAVLEQIGDDGHREPLGFFSRKLDEREQMWSAYDLELLAVYSAVEHFELLISGREITIFTDHRPLTYLFTTNKRCKIERRSRYAEYIAQFTTKIVHVAGAANVVADALSRPEEEDQNDEVAMIEAPVTPKDIALSQKNDDEIATWRKHGYRDQVLKEIKVDEECSLLCSTHQGNDRPIVPQELRFKVYRQIHSIAHNGLKATTKLLRTRYYWPGMTAEIRKWHRACPQCQAVKTQRHTVPPIGEFPVADRLEHIHMDLVGPLKPSSGYTYLCTFIDRSTRWIEAVTLRTITAEAVAKAFYENWVARYGTPLRLTSDRGPQFRSDLFAELTRLLGAQHIQTTAYHPQANGLVERMHRRLKELLTCHSQNWATYLPSILLGLRSAPRDETGVSCAEMLFGQTLRLPGELQQQTEQIKDSTQFVKQLRTVLRNLRPASFQNKRKMNIFIHDDLSTCKRVYVRVDKVKASLEPPYKGPYPVLSRHKHYFRIEIDGKEDSVSIGRLKPANEIDFGDEIQTGRDATERPKSILKVTGKEPILVREGQTINNTKLNSNIIYINDNPQNLFPDPPRNRVRIDPIPADISDGDRELGIQDREPVLRGNGSGVVRPQNETRQSNRVKKPPARLRDFIT